MKSNTHWKHLGMCVIKYALLHTHLERSPECGLYIKQPTEFCTHALRWKAKTTAFPLYLLEAQVTHLPQRKKKYCPSLSNIYIMIFSRGDGQEKSSDQKSGLEIRTDACSFHLHGSLLDWMSGKFLEKYTPWKAIWLLSADSVLPSPKEIFSFRSAPGSRIRNL